MLQRISITVNQVKLCGVTVCRDIRNSTK